MLILFSARCLFSSLLSLSFLCCFSSASQSVLRFDVYSANLSYFEQAVAYTVQVLHLFQEEKGKETRKKWNRGGQIETKKTTNH